MPTISTSPSEEEAAKLKLQGNNLFNAKKYKAAANKYRQAIGKDPSCSVYYTNLCATLHRLKLYEKMNTVASKCVTVDDKSVKGHYWLIMSLKKQKKLKDAFGQSEKSLEKFPRNSDIKFIQSEIATKLKRCAHEQCQVEATSIENDLLKCSSCKETYYCSRDCQKSDWPRHRFRCISSRSNAGSLSNTCNACKKIFPRVKEVSCGICETVVYCSQECLEKDKKLHWPKCQLFGLLATPKEIDYINKWFDNEISDILAELATHAMTRNEFLNKNPDFHIEFEVEFFEKYFTFVPIKKAKVVYFSDLPASESKGVEQIHASYKDLIGPFEVGHVLSVRFKLKSGFVVVRRRHMKYTATQYQQLSQEEALASSLNYVNNIHNPLLPAAWKNLFAIRVSAQIEGWKANCDDLFNFIVTSYRYQSKSSFKCPQEYTLVLKIEFGEQLGEVKRIVSHSMNKISRLKQPDLVKRLKEEIARGPNVLTVSVLSNNPYTSPISTVFSTIVPFQYAQVPRVKEKEIDREIMKLWKSLLKVPFPKCPLTPKYLWP
ncbi:hypothetical protein CTEN210_02876 [Chaetoceros tenuissimus]|uniref:RING-type E3 ubiquitin transferase n=1 Tax=Chaetoceros tenuissimus TaxID=426638 RepID=A0AAD3CHX0_9STRA|nr:hypothetical protein CTEN210_02876 [Chaetoceros tenuissimus]